MTMDIPNSGAIFTLGKSHLAENTQSYFYIKNDPVKRLISGPRQSAVICESGRLFVWGENHFGQLGVGSSTGNNNNNDIITKPTCVKSLKTLGLKIADIAFGNDWAAILTHSNELFFTGRSIFPANSNVARNFSNATVADEQCAIIRKPFRLEDFDEYLSKSEEAENYVEVLAGNEHFVVLTSFGRLIAWGANQSHQLGLPNDRIVQQPHEIKLDAPVQQVVCGPESTLVLTTSGKLYFTGRLNEFLFPQFTELQQNLAPTEQIIFMHISKTNEIYIVTNASSIYRSMESLRNKSLIFQRFYDYDSEENGPIWKMLKGFSFYAVLTKANKFYTTFSESGHHLKTFREISKFKNLRLLDMAVGEQHILVHGIPRSSTLSATVGPMVSGETHRFMSRTFVMPTTEAIGTLGSRVKSETQSAEKVTEKAETLAAKQVGGEQLTAGQFLNVPDPNSNDVYKATAPDQVVTPPKRKMSVYEQHKGSLDTDGNVETIDVVERKSTEAYENMQGIKREQLKRNLEKSESSESLRSFQQTENNINADESIHEAEKLLATTVTTLPNGPKSPTESIKSHKSARSIKFEPAALERNTSPAEKALRPRTPYPESSTTGSTPQTVKKTPLRNYSYEAAMDHDYLDRTSPALMDSLENIPESVEGGTAGTSENDKEKGAAKSAVGPITATVSSPTPPIEEDEQLTVEINTTTDALDRTVVVNEIRFINNGVDVTANVKEQVRDPDDESTEGSLDEHLDNVTKEAAGVFQKIEQRAEKEVDSAIDRVVERKNELQTGTKETTHNIADKMEAKLGEARESVEMAAKKAAVAAAEVRESAETVAKKAATGARDAVDSVGDNAKRMASDTKQTVEGIGSSAMKVATGAKNAVGNVFIKMSDGTKEAVDTVATKIANEVQGAKENISSLLGGKQQSKNVAEEDDVSVTSKEGGAKTNTTTGEDDERTTASVNSTQTSAGNPFEGGNPFDSSNPFENEMDVAVERGKKALRDEITAVEQHVEQQTEKSKGKVRQFFSDIRDKGKGISCRNEKSIRIEDEPPHYSVEDQFPTPTQRQQQNNTSTVCSIL